jgi:enoyl-CoA hydratase/carnithine racemase
MPQTEFETIDWTFDEETGIGTIVLDRTDSLNALSEQLKTEVVEGFRAFEAIDDRSHGVEVRAVVVEGAGEKAFSAGADITEFSERVNGIFDPEGAYDAAEEFGAPVIAKIDGHCLGGGLELALSCDFRIASERSEFGFPEVNIGLIPGGGGTQRLSSLVGPNRAKEICMLGDHLSAETALEEGIVTDVYPADELDGRVSDFASDIADQAPLAVRALKDVINMSHETGLREGRMYEHRAILTLFETEDHSEAAEAFAEDRVAEFNGR